jgi:hypothetical protein
VDETERATKDGIMSGSAEFDLFLLMVGLVGIIWNLIL